MKIFQLGFLAALVVAASGLPSSMYKPATRKRTSNDRCMVFRCLMHFIRNEYYTEDCNGDLEKARQCAREASVCDCSKELLTDTMDMLFLPKCDCKSREVRDCLSVVDDLFLTMVYSGNPPPTGVRKRMYSAAETCLGEIDKKGLSKEGCEDKFEFPRGGQYLLISARAWSNGCDNVKKVLVDCDTPLEYSCGAGEDGIDSFLQCVNSSLPETACKPLTSQQDEIKEQLTQNQQARCRNAMETQKKLGEKCELEYDEEEDNVINTDYYYETPPYY